MRGVLLIALIFGVACGDDDAGVPDASSRDDASVDAGRDAGAPEDTFVPEAFAAPEPLVDLVNPLIGTGGLGYSVGSSSPAPQRPFGLARPAPDTATEAGAPGFNHCAGYNWYDDLIQGFSQVRPHGMGIAEYGAIALMPTLGMDASKTNKVGYGEAFSHDDETVELGYYDVTLGESGIRAELTAGDRVARHRYTFPAGASDRTILLDVGHTIGELEILDAEITVDVEAQEMRGFSRFSGGYSGRNGGVAVYFVARFDQPFAGVGTWQDGALTDATLSVRAPNAGGYAVFDADVVNVAVGLSFSDVEHAGANLDAEPEDFDAMRAATRDAWEPVLGRARIEARSEREHVIFYSALYRALLMPTLASDADGTYRGLDGELHAVDEGERYYTDHSLWDTFRTQGPLLSLLYPELQRDITHSLLRMARDGGWAPRWPLGTNYTGGMNGDSADIWITDAWRKGIPMDPAEAYALLRPTAFGPTPEGAPYGGRGGIESYLERGYVHTSAAGWSASRTLEFAYDDAVLADLAEAVGETADAAALRERGGNWRTLWDDERGFFFGRDEAGAFPEEVDLNTWQDFYAEGTPWQYLWYVPHDVEGLATQMGGRDRMLERLEQFFMRSTTNRLGPAFPPVYYWHGNEPDIHAPFLFSALDRPELASRWVHWVIAEHYDDTPEGLPGNDDAGTLSAWYVFATLGIFPIAGTDVVYVAAPTVPRAELAIPGGALTIDAEGAALGRADVQAITLDGVETTGAVEHAGLRGATLRTSLRR